jgi:hypothetical protein
VYLWQLILTREKLRKKIMGDNEQMIDELCSMFNKDVRADVRLTASNQILSLTGSSEGRLFIRQNKKLVRQFFWWLLTKIIS